MEVRFRDVSISADIMVKDETDVKVELPTLVNVIKTGIREMRSSKHVVKKQILRNVSGVFKPGTITLVLGQPGSGKSSLMKLISGRFPQDKNITTDGEVTYNGTPANDLRKRLPQFVSYVTQRDKHYPLLTVKETLEFAHACCGGGLSKRDEQHFMNGTPEENKAALDAARAMFKHYPDIVIQQLGLDNCQNTIVGDAMTRGVSGGERKRVTTGEMEFGNKYVMMMDEISTGLDSAATFDIITTQRSIAKKFRKTVVISLLQPSPEVFELFDDVVILNEGHVMYHGPRAEALGYFESLGFKCPPRRDVADFLLDLGTDKQGQYEVEVARGISIPRTSSDFADAFERSPIYDRMRADLEDPVHPGLVHDKETHVDSLPEFHQNFWDSTSLLMKRQIRVTLRDSAALIGRLFMNTIMGLLYSSVFYQFNPTNAQLVIGVIFASVLCLSLGQSAQIPTVMAAREVFYKQRGANFFRTASYVLSSSVSQLPPIILESVVFGSIVYWMCGFVDTIGAFFLFLLMLCLSNLALTSFFFFLASAAPNFNVANPISSVSILFFILFGGFVITKEQIPDYLIWVYWINPIAWSVRALAVNQYSDSAFDKCTYGDVNFCESFNQTVGDYSLGLFEVPSEKFWLWYGIVFMGAAYVFFMFLSYIALEYHRYESPENVTLDENKDDVNGEYGLMRTPRGAPSEDETLVSVAPDREKHFIPVTVAFKDLWYSVPDPANPKDTIDLLKGISGYALPGTITALMGSSGAGKTTLMDVIAGRKTGGTIKGQILLNGHPATDLAIRRSTGYCEQMDIHSDSATIREALTFSAFLRQGADIPDSYKYDSVNECLDLLDLHPIADQIIRGSSVEQMKRLTIGVELAAQPSVLFLDEPTSGLDARSAKLIMAGVRKVANTGRTVVCTIHQPSTEVFSVFDSLLLLKRGGETVFAGELGKNAREMIAYFESIDGVTKLEDNYNPATWMLEVIGAGVGNSNGDKTDFVKIFQSSKHFDILQSNLDREGVSRPSPSMPALEYGDKRAATELTQAKFLMQRFFNMYWRTASYNLTRFSLSLILGVVFGITYASAEYSSYAGINSGMGMLFCTTGFIAFIAFTSVIPVASEDRLAFYRERAAQTYNALWYFVGSTVVEIPYVFFSTLLLMAPYYPLVGFTGVTTFFAYWFHLSMHVLWQAYFGQLMSVLMPTVEVSAIFGVLLQMIFFLFNGFNPPGGSIPTGYKWLYHITPHKYSLALVASIVFGDCPSDGDGSEIGCQVMTGLPPSVPEGTTVKSYLEDVFLMKHSEIWKNFGFVLGFIVITRILGLITLRFVNHQKNRCVRHDVKKSDVELPTIANELKKAFAKLGAKKSVAKKPILNSVSGVFKPGTVTLVLGQPGSGKSSLMKVLSGHFSAKKNITLNGEISYNGAPSTSMQKSIPQFVANVTQRDKHFPTLTVKETLEFAHACCGGALSKRAESHFVHGTPEENEGALKAARALYKHYPELVIKQLGLENCQNTLVGNGMLRGVSGGERKRVTTGDGSNQFADAFKRSAIYARMMEDLNGPIQPVLIHDLEKHVDPLPEFHQSFIDSTITLMQRQPKVIMRNKAFLKGGAIMVVIMGLLYSMLFLSLGQASQIPTFMAARDIFYKQRRANFFRTSTYVLSSSVSQIPLALMERDGVRKVANTGHTIVCTIHQPSSEVFQVFDSLLLLKRGGQTVFFGELGEKSSNLIQYFETVDGVPKLKDCYNPATWMLEVIGAGVSGNGDKMDFVAHFKASDHFKSLQANLDHEGVSRQSPSIPAVEFSEKRAATEAMQMKFLVKRFFAMYWRSSLYNLTRFFISLILGLLFGLVFIGAEGVQLVRWHKLGYGHDFSDDNFHRRNFIQQCAAYCF
ncbi:unnamed protein product [Phytophthora lilii]|uniref:Unnamed protein product n=1 Tax=Phytophthora lilii TaxID=2077276 RepID=A0A9W6UDC6_9STRA|nr:unnamed protein product [Phytophthora lilii]